jgi:tetratricopeptide (TPR) repeat protein
MDNDWQKPFKLAVEASRAGNHEYAELLLSTALLEAEDFGKADERYIITLVGLTDVLTKQFKFRRAEKTGRQILDIFREIHGTEHLSYADSAFRLGQIYHMQQKYGQAEPLYKAALSIKTKQLGGDNASVLQVLHAYADLLNQTHRELEAENLRACAQKAAQARQSNNSLNAVQPTPPPSQTNNQTPAAAGASEHAAWSAKVRFDAAAAEVPNKVPALSYEELEEKAEAAFASGQYDKALEFWNQAISQAEGFAAKDARLGKALDKAGEVLFAMEKFGQAEMIWGRSLQLKISLYGSNHPNVADTGHHLAGLHYLMGRYTEAENYARKCLQVYSIAYGKSHASVALCHHNLATLFHVQGRYAEAETEYNHCINIRKVALGPTHKDTMHAEKGLADLLKTLGRDKEAEQVSAKANGLVTGSWKALKLDASEALQPSPPKEPRRR